MQKRAIGLQYQSIQKVQTNRQSRRVPRRSRRKCKIERGVSLIRHHQHRPSHEGQVGFSGTLQSCQFMHWLSSSSGSMKCFSQHMVGCRSLIVQGERKAFQSMLLSIIDRCCSDLRRDALCMRPVHSSFSDFQPVLYRDRDTVVALESTSRHGHHPYQFAPAQTFFYRSCMDPLGQHHYIFPLSPGPESIVRCPRGSMLDCP